jgi:hypothetical protein
MHFSTSIRGQSLINELKMRKPADLKELEKMTRIWDDLEKVGTGKTSATVAATSLADTYAENYYAEKYNAVAEADWQRSLDHAAKVQANMQARPPPVAVSPPVQANTWRMPLQQIQQQQLPVAAMAPMGGQRGGAAGGYVAGGAAGNAAGGGRGRGRGGLRGGAAGGAAGGFVKQCYKCGAGGPRNPDEPYHDQGSPVCEQHFCRRCEAVGRANTCLCTCAHNRKGLNGTPPCWECTVAKTILDWEIACNRATRLGTAVPARPAIPAYPNA